MNWLTKISQETNHADYIENLLLEGDIQDIFQYLDQHGIEYYPVKFTNKEVYVVILDDEPYVLDDDKFITSEGWVQNIRDFGSVYDYYSEHDFNKEFWRDVGDGIYVYHGTKSDRLTNIQKNGLEVRDETRGVENKYTGAAIFTSTFPDEAKIYDVILSINVSQMKRDGYMPVVSMEKVIEEAELIESLAHKVGLEEYYVQYEQGLSPLTVIFYGDIPAKYLWIES